MKTPLILLSVILILAVGAGAAFLLLRPRSEPVTQPIKFNHKVHLDPKVDLTCAKCHTQVENGPHATMPTIKQCLMCHKEPQGESAEEAKIREYAKEGREIPWQQANRVVGHVYFSHAAHVKYGKMKCEECHGNTADRTEPVTESQIDHLTMAKCMQCHEEKKVSNDCLICHK